MNKMLAGILCCLLLGSCTKEIFQKKAVITGFDYRKCACCSGLMVNFTNDTVPYRSAFSLVRNRAEDLGISRNGPFPVYVSIDFVKEKGCNDQFIRVVRLKRL